MADYLFTVNLTTDDLMPDFQVTSVVDKKTKFRFLPGKMPLVLKNKDTLDFSFVGRSGDDSFVVECSMYVRPVSFDGDEARSPFKLVGSEHKNEWVFVIRGKNIKNKIEVNIGNNKEIYEFSIAGTFSSQVYENQSFILPFFVDPEVVVGGQEQNFYPD